MSAKQTPSLIEKYYNKFNEDHRLTTRHGQVEFNTTMHFIKKFLSQLQHAKELSSHDLSTVEATNKAQRVSSPQTQCAKELRALELGAGTGKYSLALCDLGCDVTAVELVKRNIEVLRSHHKKIKTWQADARDISFLDDEKFDLTLVFGPLYHLHGDENKLKVLNEAKRVTKKGGIIMIAYVMNEYSLLTYCFQENRMAEIKKKGGITKDFHINTTEEDLYSYTRLEDADRLNQLAGLERITVFSPDGASDYMRETLNAMDDKTFEIYKDYQIQIAERADLIGAGSHIVDVVRKI